MLVVLAAVPVQTEDAMKPLFQASMVNGPFEDPVLFLDFLFEKRALLFDIGDVRALAPRKLLRISDIFVTHTHMDHFADFDWLLRLYLGRAKRLRLFGPPHFIDQVEHKLQAYTWNLVHNYEADFTVVVTELHPNDRGRRAEFHCQRAFAREGEVQVALPRGVLIDENALQVRGTLLDHGIPCLGFTVEEKLHVNIWKNRLQEMGLPVGPWLAELKQAVLAGCPDELPIRVWWREGDEKRERYLPLGELKDQVIRMVAGQKISYVVDVAYHEQNARRIIELIEGSDLLYIEAFFLEQDAELGVRKCHLTAPQAGLLARQAGVKQMVPIQFSPRYLDREPLVRQEAQAAFSGTTISQVIEESAVALPVRIKHYLQSLGVDYQLVAHPRSFSTKEAAEAAHIPEDHIAKAVLFKDEQGLLMVVIPGNGRVKLHTLQRDLNRDLELSPKPEVDALFEDCRPGAIPPLGLAYNLETVLDEAFTLLATVYFEAGDQRHLVQVKGEAFHKLLAGVRRGYFSHYGGSL